MLGLLLLSSEHPWQDSFVLGRRGVPQARWNPTLCWRAKSSSSTLSDISQSRLWLFTMEFSSMVLSLPKAPLLTASLWARALLEETVTCRKGVLSQEFNATLADTTPYPQRGHQQPGIWHCTASLRWARDPYNNYTCTYIYIYIYIHIYIYVQNMYVYNVYIYKYIHTHLWNARSRICTILRSHLGSISETARCSSSSFPRLHDFSCL